MWEIFYETNVRRIFYVTVSQQCSQYMFDVSTSADKAFSYANCKISDDVTSYISRYSTNNVGHCLLQFVDVSRLVDIHTIFGVSPEEEVWRIVVKTVSFRAVPRNAREGY